MTEIVTGALLVLFTLIFVLHGGRNICAFVTKIFPPNVRDRVRDAGRAGFHSLIGYVRATFLVALVDAVGIGTGLAIMGVPLALPLASLVFLGAFVPLVGAVVAGFLAVIVALIAKGLIYALITLGLIIAVQQLEGHVLQPLVMGRAVSIHPLAVVLAIAGGGVLAGIVGALLAVPTVAFLNSAVRVLLARDPEAEEAAQESQDGPILKAEADDVGRRQLASFGETAKGLEPALAAEQILCAHPATAALGLFFFSFFPGVELLGRRLGLRLPLRRDGRRRVRVLRPRTSSAIGWAPCLRGWAPRLRGEGPQRGNRRRRLVARLRARLPLASPASGGSPHVGHRPSGVRRRARRWAPSPRLARGPMRGEWCRLPCRGRGATQFAQPRFDFAFLPWCRGRRGRRPGGPLSVTRGWVVDPGGRIVHDIAHGVLRHRKPRGLWLVGLGTSRGNPRRARTGRGVGPRRGRDPCRGTRP